MRRGIMSSWTRQSMMSGVFAILVFAPGIVRATVIRVPEDYPKVQLAIDVANSGDTVLVAGGRYAPSTNGEAFPINMKNGVRLLGAGAETCTLDAERTNRVIYCSGISDATTRIEGFTITNGEFTEWPGRGGGIMCIHSSLIITNNVITGNIAHHGGGIFCREYSSPTITNNVITENSAGYNGGGISCSSSSPTITDNVITGNSARYGGGISCSSSSPTITNNVITENSAGYNGGGIYCSSSFPIITNNIITGNSSSFYGGGISCLSSSPTITNNVITGNSSDYYGGGISCYYHSNPTITNSVVTGNSAGNDGGGIYCGYYSAPPITYDDVWSNTPNNYSGCSPGIGCISVDPLFVGPMVGDYHLQLGSPCIDAGNNDAPCLPEFDFDGNPRIINGVVDMGAFEYQVSIIEATIDIDPDRLNLKSQGRWVTCYIELPEDYSVEDIDTSTVDIIKIDNEILNLPLSREGPTEIDDYDEDGIIDLMVKFNRQELITLLKEKGVEDRDEVELTVSGDIIGGKSFEGSDIIVVINKGKSSDDSELIAATPKSFILYQCSPNPFRNATAIIYDLPIETKVKLEIYNLMGQKIATLVDEYQLAGRYNVEWDGKDNKGEELATGFYFYKFEVKDYKATKKMLLLR